MKRKLLILGTRGIPAKHGGFETFCEQLSLFLIARDWLVTVYCQEQGRGSISESSWCGVRRIHIPVPHAGPRGTITFDWKATRHAMSQEGLALTLGYNTALFNLLFRMKGKVNVINMDGVEWHRDKWGAIAKVWFWLNEGFGCRVANHLIADHPSIKTHLTRRVSDEKITMIPYGARAVEAADIAALSAFDLVPNGFVSVIARPEPENSVLEIVRAFAQKKRGKKLVLLGDYHLSGNPYHRSVRDAASDEVIFPGAIYDKRVVDALRFYGSLYVHGHTVGGTNPSLVEALGAGSAVLAHDNRFNRWVAGSASEFFEDEASCAAKLDSLLQDEAKLSTMRRVSRERFQNMFTWDSVLTQYEKMLSEFPAKVEGTTSTNLL
ncbi:MAG TPA: DUF1972 domain-containing protein [Gammaproteobacteria bacterium]|nr:DUF1972 domain-containing protein [Gammaproteobacteria bacterium]